MKIFLLISLIGAVCANPTAGVAEKEAIEKAEKVVTAYHNAISDLVSWTSYKKKTQRFSTYQNYYSLATGPLMGDTKTYIMNGDDHFFSATQAISNFCGESVATLAGYIELLSDANGDNEEIAVARKSLLSPVLGSEIEKLNEASSQIKETANNFHKALTKLTEITTEFEKEHSEEDVFFKTFVEAYELQAANDVSALERIANATILAVKELNRMGLGHEILNRFLEGYSTIAPVTGAYKFKLTLKAKFAEIDTFFNTLENEVTETIANIESAEAKLEDEIKEIETSKTQLDGTAYVPITTEVRTAIKNAANKFIKKCESYRNIHNKF